MRWGGMCGKKAGVAGSVSGAGPLAGAQCRGEPGSDPGEPCRPCQGLNERRTVPA